MVECNPAIALVPADDFGVLASVRGSLLWSCRPLSINAPTEGLQDRVDPRQRKHTQGRTPVGLETKRLTLRTMTVADADAFFALNSHPHVLRLTGEPPLNSA